MLVKCAEKLRARSPAFSFETEPEQLETFTNQIKELWKTERRVRKILAKEPWANEWVQRSKSRTQANFKLHPYFEGDELKFESCRFALLKEIEKRVEAGEDISEYEVSNDSSENIREEQYNERVKICVEEETKVLAEKQEKEEAMRKQMYSWSSYSSKLCCMCPQTFRKNLPLWSVVSCCCCWCFCCCLPCCFSDFLCNFFLHKIGSAPKIMLERLFCCWVDCNDDFDYPYTKGEDISSFFESKCDNCIGFVKKKCSNNGEILAFVLVLILCCPCAVCYLMLGTGEEML